MGAADLRRAVDVREGLRALLLQNNGLEPDPARIERLDAAAQRAGVRVRSPSRRRARKGTRRSGRGRRDRGLAGDRRSAPAENGTWERLQGVSSRGVRVGLLRPLEEPLGTLVPHRGLREHREGASFPERRPRRPATRDRSAGPRHLALERTAPRLAAPQPLRRGCACYALDTGPELALIDPLAPPDPAPLGRPWTR